jgi:predicted branched-subunit amino acid permease
MQNTLLETTAPDTTTPSPRGELAAGARAMAPMILAYAPFGLLVGAAVAASEHPLAAWLSTWTIYGGAAHLAVLDVLQRDAGLVAAVFVGLLINARITAYAVSMAPTWRTASALARAAAAMMLTDATWAMAHHRSAANPAAVRRYYFGAGLTLWIGWPSLVTVGALTGSWLHAFPVATLMPTLTLAAMAVPHLRARPGLAAGVGAVVTAVATASWSSGPALALSAAVGTFLAALVHHRNGRTS